MNFSLRKLESHVGEAHLLRAEELLDAGAVEPLQEIERHLWVTHVRDDDNRWEVEVKISPSRIVAATCDCSRFEERQECGHFVAVLMKLRRHLQRRKEEKKHKKQRRTSGKPRKLTTSVVLRNVDHDELIDFVKEYARTHRNFAITLKARFAGNVGSIDSREKFIQLLHSTINMARRPDRSISKRGQQKIMKVLRELREQAREAMAAQHFTETLSIAQGTIEKISPILGKITADPEELKSEIQAAFEIIQQLISYSLPPALRRSLWNYLMEEHSKLTYRSHQMDHYFLQRMLELANEPKDFKQLLTAIDRQAEKYQAEGRQPGALWLLKLQTLENAGREKAAQQFIEERLLRPQILRRAIDQSIQNEQWARARQLCRLGLEKFQDPELKRTLEYRLINIARKQDDPETLQAILESQFLRELDLSIYHQLCKYREGDEEGFHQALIGKVQKEAPPSPRRRDVIAFLHAESGQPEALMRYLEETGSLELLQRYDHYLLQSHKDGLLRLYRHLLTDYIQNHLGPKSSSNIRQMIHHLHEIGMSDLAVRLVDEFRSTYPERHTLMEELALF